MTSQTLATHTAPLSSRPLLWLAAASVIWIAGVTMFANAGGFEMGPGEPPIAIVITVAVPLVLFALAMLASPAARALALGLDPVLLTELQAWRVLGGLFLGLYAFGHLPGLFAWPAGVGDVAVGIAAPFIAWRLRTQPSFLTSARFRLFQYAGLADFVVAIVAGLAAREVIPGLVGAVTTAPMGQLPLVLIPAIVVPAFIILHLIALMQISAGRDRAAR